MPAADQILTWAEAGFKLVAVIVGTAFVAGYFACLFCFVVKR